MAQRRVRWDIQLSYTFNIHRALSLPVAKGDS
jgi:hypothetical protein